MSISLSTDAPLAHYRWVGSDWPSPL